MDPNLWKMAENFGSTGLIIAAFYVLMNRWAGPFLLALRDHTQATTQQAEAIASLANTVRESQSDQREVLIAVRVLASKMDQFERAISAMEGSLKG